MQGTLKLFKKIQNWLAPKKRHSIVLAAVATVAALTTTISSINSYSIYSFKLPTGPLVWLSNSALGAHEVDPQYSQACVTHDRYYPIGQPVDQSGWPVSFEYDYFAVHYGCQSMFYPVLFIIDFILFAAIYAALLLVLPRLVIKLRQNRHITRRRIIFVIAASAMSVFVSYETASFVYVTQPYAQAPPLISTVATSSYEIPISFPLCPFNDVTVNKEICHGPAICALTGISQPSDPRYAIQGLPFAYVYSSLDPCFGDTIYPLLFLADTLVYLAVLSAVAIGINHVLLLRNKAN